jgi:phosphoribosyl 1,2-cyclic phosphate phosphodiesterase
MTIKSGNNLTVTILGTGTSHGVPIVGCKCEVCISDDIRDKRTRTSALLSWGETNIAIDIGPDFRQQMLRAQVDHLEGILITHQHNDHVIGLDEIRPFNFISKSAMNIYATIEVQSELKHRFSYAFDKEPYPGAPKVNFIDIQKDQTILINGREIIPVEVGHGNMTVLGFRIGNFAYITDAKTINPEELRKLEGLDVLVVNALHYHEHFAHFNVSEALDLISFLKPEKAYLTHISHKMGKHTDVNQTLPEGVALAYDGLQINM